VSIEKQIIDLKTEYETNPTFEKLAELRSIMVTAQDANNASDGFRRLLTEMYPDTAHFVYELLQNAEDASKENSKPSTVTFTLLKEELNFEHYGKKLFDVYDVAAITSLGESPKRDDPTSIGKFGIGFKSVFAYSNSPEIHSGKYHFKIEGLFVPSIENVEELQTGNKTLFILPFNNPSKNSEKAVQEIEHGLRELGTETLLFLKNINKVEYILPDGNTFGSMECIPFDDNDKNIIEIHIATPDEEERSSFWLRYSKSDVTAVDEKGNSVDCSVSIAYMLEEDSTKEYKNAWKIVSDEESKVCIFFPAEKETSKLRFHIHAPFASTVARDSVRDCEENETLRDAIADLVVESLFDIKQRGLLTVDFLGTLPIEEDNLSPLYEPIREKIVEAFQSAPLLPTKSGKYAPAKTLFCGPAPISEVIDDDDLTLLTGQKTAKWVKNAPLQHQREDKFLDSLNIAEWNWDELQEVFDPKTDEERKRIEKWIRTKSDNWLMRLYALLNNEHFTEFGDETLKIVRTTKGSFVKASDAYFIPDDDGDMPNRLNFVKAEVYKAGGTEKQKKDAKEFLARLGVKKYDEREKVSLCLKKYDDEAYHVLNARYWKDFKRFIKYSTDHQQPNDLSIFQNIPFIVGECGDKKEWVTVSQLRLTTAENEDEVEELWELLPDNYEPSSIYDVGNLGERYFAEIASFFKRIGATAYSKEELVGIRASRYRDYPDVNWETHLLDISEFVSFAKQYTSGGYNYELSRLLGYKCFIYGADEKYHKPEEISVYPMSALSHIHGYVGISEKYGELADEVNELISRLGAVCGLEIEEKYHYDYSKKHNNKPYIVKDYFISHLNEYLKAVDNRIEIAMLILRAIIFAGYRYEHTETRPNDGRFNFEETNQPSSIVTTLKNHAWLPDIDRNYRKPIDISKAELHPIVSAHVGNFDEKTPLFQAIRFGEDAKDKQQTRKQENEALETLGLTGLTKDGQRLLKEALERGEDIEAIFREQKRKKDAFPAHPAPNPARRAGKIADEYRESQFVEYKSRPTVIRTSRSSIDPRPYLHNLYCDDSNEVYCQICGETNGFVKRDDKYYFEAVEAFKPDILPHEHESKFLCLCAVCSAKYDEFFRYKRKEATDEMIALRDKLMNSDDINIPIVLGDEDATIRFVEKHLIDIKAVIKSEEENNKR
jgi:hypothetical protein